MKNLLTEFIEGSSEGDIKEDPNKKVTKKEIKVIHTMSPLRVIIDTLSTLHKGMVMAIVEIIMVLPCVSYGHYPNPPSR